MFDDPIVAEVRKIRDRIAARYNYDVFALGAYYRELEKQMGLTTVSHPAKRVFLSLETDDNQQMDQPTSRLADPLIEKSNAA